MTKEKPIVGIVCGSVSDFPAIEETMKVLDMFGIGYSVDVKSAHRLPDDMRRYALEAEEKGYRVIIAVAGGAVDLSGMIAAYTILPVIGLPVKTSALSGLDSLYSMVQMPEGIPVAVVGIGRGKNAGLFAAEVLAVSDRKVRSKLLAYREELAAKTREDAKKNIGKMRASRKHPGLK
ncbi:MAG: 5-(carboxyamino)imidazole ribonucleotide mutase [Thaumarchaeota archaeon]|nr:5-(carboxyamino)imidazole ribonucleotide mutase [Nitrososphaerota archaeon]